MRQRGNAGRESFSAAWQTVVCRLLHVGDGYILGAEVGATCKLGEEMAKAHEILVTDNLAKETALLRVSLTMQDKALLGAVQAFGLNFLMCPIASSQY